MLDPSGFRSHSFLLINQPGRVEPTYHKVMIKYSLPDKDDKKRYWILFYDLIWHSAVTLICYCNHFITQMFSIRKEPKSAKWWGDAVNSTVPAKFVISQRFDASSATHNSKSACKMGSGLCKLGLNVILSGCFYIFWGGAIRVRWQVRSSSFPSSQRPPGLRSVYPARYLVEMVV